MLTAADLLEYRSTLELSLQDEAEVYEVAPVEDGSGGWTDDTTLIATVPARLSPMSGREAPLAGRLSLENMLVLTIPARTPLTAKDQVVVYHLDPETGVVTETRPVEVQLVFAPRTYEISRRAFVTELL